MSKNEPAIIVRIKERPTVVKNAPLPRVQALMSIIARLEAANKTILDRGPPTKAEAAVIAANNGKLATARTELATERANATASAPSAPVNNPAELDITRAVTKLEYEDSEKKSAELTLTLENNDLRWLDSPLLDQGTVLLVGWGYVGNLRPLREVIVQKVTGFTELTIKLADKGQLMHKLAKNRTFTNVSRAEVVRLIAEENGFGREAQVIDDGPSSLASSPEVDKLSSEIASLKKLKKDILDKGPPTKESAVLLGQYDAKINRLSTSLGDARKASLKPKSAGGVVKYDVITQAGQTDAQLLKRLADLQGFEFFIAPDGLHWHPRRVEAKPVKELWYYTTKNVGDIISISLEADAKAKPATVTTKGVDPLEKKAITSVASDATVARTTLAPTPELASGALVVDPVTGETHTQAASDPGTAVHPTSQSTPEAAKTDAEGKFIRTQQSAIQLTLTIEGDPGLSAKTVIVINGIGKRLSGRYYITQINDNIGGSAYTQTLKVRTDGVNGKASPKTDSAGQPNTKNAPPAGDGKVELVPTLVVDPVTGETKSSFVDPRTITGGG